MKRQIPRGDEDLDCPLHRQPMSEVCHRCPWWTQVRGKDPQSEREIDHWGCAIGLLPMLLIEGSQQTRQAGAAIESFRNEMQKQNAGAVNVMAALVDGLAPRRLIDGRSDELR